MASSTDIEGRWTALAGIGRLSLRDNLRSHPQWPMWCLRHQTQTRIVTQPLPHIHRHWAEAQPSPGEATMDLLIIAGTLMALFALLMGIELLLDAYDEMFGGD